MQNKIHSKIKAKKSLGQNFLKSEKALDKIIEAGDPTPDEIIIEIGPGEGVLTERLLKRGAKVLIIEKDDRLIPVLEEKFREEVDSHKLKITHNNILNIDVSKSLFDTGQNITNYKVIANIPYYITGQILRKFLNGDRKPTSMTLLVQKEVAERIIARDDKESILSLSVKIFGTPKYIATVNKSSFKPQPKVDSAILNIENIRENKISSEKIDFFFKVIHSAFKHKRKQLLPNLSHDFEKEKIIKAFEKLNINPKTRAEDVSLQTWIELCNIISE